MAGDERIELPTKVLEGFPTPVIKNSNATFFTVIIPFYKGFVNSF